MLNSKDHLQTKSTNHRVLTSSILSLPAQIPTLLGLKGRSLEIRMASAKLTVGIIGGGVAGLYTALSLHELGHHATVFEANDRLGGRIYTHHFKPVHPGENPFFEAGAMRIPLSSWHIGVFDLIRYLNTQNNVQVQMIPYVLQHHNNTINFNGQTVRCEDRQLSVEFGLPQPYAGKSAREIMMNVMDPWIDLLRRDFERGFKEIMLYEDLSFRQYLHWEASMPHNVIDFVETVMSQTNQYDLGFLELVMQTLHFSTPRMYSTFDLCDSHDDANKIDHSLANSQGWALYHHRYGGKAN